MTQIAYLLTFNNGDEVRRFPTLNEVYTFIIDEQVDKFLIEKITKTIVAERN